MPHIGGEGESMRSILDEVAYTVCAVMRHLKSRDLEVADHERSLFLDNPFGRGDTFLHVATLLDAAMHALGGIDGDAYLLTQVANGLNVVGMVMRDQYRYDLIEI